VLRALIYHIILLHFKIFFLQRKIFFFRCCKFGAHCSDVAENSVLLRNDSSVLLNQILTFGGIIVSSFQSSKCPQRVLFRCVQITAFPLLINLFFFCQSIVLHLSTVIVEPELASDTQLLNTVMVMLYAFAFLNSLHVENHSELVTLKFRSLVCKTVKFEDCKLYIFSLCVSVTEQISQERPLAIGFLTRSFGICLYIPGTKT
jgi:hypothetical protein